MSQLPKETLDQLRHYHQVTYCEPLSDEFLVQTLKDLLADRQRAEIKARFRDWPPSRVVALIQATHPEPLPLQPPAPSEPVAAILEPSEATLAPALEPKRSITPLPISPVTNPLGRKRGSTSNA